MGGHVDRLLFIRTIGSLRVLVEVARAFLRQSAPWRTALDKSSNPFDARELSVLVHKMKGSCYAVAAFGVAETLKLAEASLPQMTQATWMPKSVELKNLITEVEVELAAVILFSESGSLPDSSCSELQ